MEDQQSQHILKLSANHFVHYFDKGGIEKKPLVWLHGGSIETASSAIRDAEFLFEDFRVVLPDLRGYGGSSGAETQQGHGISEKSNDIAELISSFSSDPIPVCGSSLGAGVALRLAIDHPEKVSRLVAITPIPFASPPGDPVWWQKNRFLLENGNIEEFVFQTLLLRRKSDLPPTVRSSPSFSRYVEGLKQRPLSDLILRMDEAFNRLGWEQDCQSITCPTLIIGGSEDSFPTREQLDLLHSLIRGSDLQIYEGADHHPHRSHKKPVREAIRTFLNSEA